MENDLTPHGFAAARSELNAGRVADVDTLRYNWFTLYERAHSRVYDERRQLQSHPNAAEQTGCSEPREGVSVPLRMSVARGCSHDPVQRGFRVRSRDCWAIGLGQNARGSSKGSHPIGCTKLTLICARTSAWMNGRS